MASIEPPLVWLLLLACALVQGAARARGVRAGAALAAMTTLGYLAFTSRGDTGHPASGIIIAAGSFLVACAAILLAEWRASRRVAELRAEADVDEGTACLNRRGFEHALQDHTSRRVRHDHELALVALDLDHFKQVNDRYGHIAGDDVLREVGSLLLTVVGADGVVARLGGEEFAALLPGLDAEAAGVVAERILAELREHSFAAMPPDRRLTMSAGIAVERVATVEQGAALRARADEALYAAKRSGRNRALLWPSGVPSNATPSGSHTPVKGSAWRRHPGAQRRGAGNEKN